MDGCTSTKILLDKETEEDKEVKDKEHIEVKLEEVRKAQKIAGEILWLSTRSRPDLAYPIQKMTSEAQCDPKKALKIGTRILRYLKGTKDFGLFYPNSEETHRRFQEMKEDWPEELIQKIAVWTDSSYASQKESKSQGAFVVTLALAPVFWKCGKQALIAQSTAESELQMLTEGSLAAKNIGKLLKEIEVLPKRNQRKRSYNQRMGRQRRVQG